MPIDKEEFNSTVELNEKKKYEQNCSTFITEKKSSEPTKVVHGDKVDSFRGKCLYKTGKCDNERAIKKNGEAHNLCDVHRSRQNKNQRKLDAKNRTKRSPKSSPYDRPSQRLDNDSHIGRRNEDGFGMPMTLPTPQRMIALAPKRMKNDSTLVKPYPRSSIMPPVSHIPLISTPSNHYGNFDESFKTRVLKKLVNVLSEEVMASQNAAAMPRQLSGWWFSREH